MTGSKITSSLKSCVAFKWSLILSPCAGALNRAGAAHLSLAGKGDSEFSGSGSDSFFFPQTVLDSCAHSQATLSINGWCSHVGAKQSQKFLHPVRVSFQRNWMALLGWNRGDR